MQEGPMKSAMEASTAGVIKQEFVTYVVEDDNRIVKKTVTRNFTMNGDYSDSVTSEPLTW